MTDKTLTKKVLQWMQTHQMLKNGGRVLVAVSGGADSVTLLSVLSELKDTLSLEVLAAAHVNHGLRGEEATRDEEFVRDLCEQWQVPLFVHHADVAKIAETKHMGLEEAGRQVRYAFFETLAQSENFTHIATAHTASDNVETVLLHMTRGCGNGGLGGIPPVRGNVIRPLLSCSRKEIEDYCTENRLPFAVDSTNTDIHYARNRVRNCIVPELYNLNPRLEEAFGRLTVLARDDESYLQQQTQAAVREARLRTDLFSAEYLKNLPTALRTRALQNILFEVAGVRAEEQHIRAIEELLFRGCGAVTVCGQATATVKQKYFTVLAGSHTPSFSPQLLVDNTDYIFGDIVYRAEIWDKKLFDENKKVHKILLHSVLDYDKMNGTVLVRTRREGDVCDPLNRGGSRSLKKWFNSERVPAFERDQIPVLADEEGVVLVAGLGCDKRVEIDESTTRVLTFLRQER